MVNESKAFQEPSAGQPLCVCTRSSSSRNATKRQSLSEDRAGQRELHSRLDPLDRRGAGHDFQQCDLAAEFAVAGFADFPFAARDKIDLVAGVIAMLGEGQSLGSRLMRSRAKSIEAAGARINRRWQSR